MCVVLMYGCSQSRNHHQQLHSQQSQLELLMAVVVVAAVTAVIETALGITVAVHML
jgi:hypothetical protein